MTEIQAIINQAVARHHAIRQKRMWLVGFAIFATVIGIAAWFDQAWIFSSGVRWACWIAGLSIATGVTRWAMKSQRMDATTLAHQVEAQAGETASVVATAIDPAVRLTAQNEAVANLLVQRLDRRAAMALQASPPTFQGRMRSPFILAAIAVFGLMILGSFKGGRCLQRVMFPWWSLPYTTVVLEGPAVVPKEADAFILTAKISGVSVGKVRIYQQGIPEPIVEGIPDANGLVRLTLNGLSEPTNFVARAGDGQSETLRISPRFLPSINTFEIIVTQPEDIAKSLKTETSPSFSVVRGSSLRYRLYLKSPAQSLHVERSLEPRQEERIKAGEGRSLYRNANNEIFGETDATDEKPASPVFRCDPLDPLIWEADWAVALPEVISYRLVIKGKDGEQVRNEEPWLITVLADTAPVVKIQSHNAAEVLKRGHEKISFKLSAVDDLKLKNACLVFRKPGEPYTHQEIKLPDNTERVWSGEISLDLAPLGLQPLDVLAVHCEVEDNNTLDGPGIGRSEVIYLEVPPPEEEPNKGEGKGGEKSGGGPPPINPLALQMEILKGAVVLNKDSPLSDRAAIAYDQRQNMEYTYRMETVLIGEGLTEVAELLAEAQIMMGHASSSLGLETAEQAVPHIESALGKLIDASKMMVAAKCECTKSSPDENFTLKPPKPKKASAGKPKDKPGSKDAEKSEKKEELRKLMAEVKRQRAEQEKLNQGNGKEPGKATKQQELAQDAKSASGAAKGMGSSQGPSGDLTAAASELDKAATLQADLTDSLNRGDGGDPSSIAKGEQSVEALTKALDHLSAQVGTGTYEGNSNPSGYERLVSDYLRSISNE